MSKKFCEYKIVGKAGLPHVFLFKLALAGFILITVQTGAFAYEIKNIKNKVAAGKLPKFCLCAGHPPPFCSKENRSRHEAYFGAIFNHIHHYCWGLDKLNIQLQSGHPSPFWLENAIHEFDYVLNHNDPKRSMHAQVWTQKGQTLLMLNKSGEAVDSFYKAIRSNSHYVPAYVYLSQHLRSIGNHSGACKILTFGVKHNPNSKTLKQLLKGCRSN